MPNPSAPHLHDPEKARVYLERLRWPDGPVCPHCGAVDRIYRLKGKAARPGLLKCGHCRKQFSVTVGTVFERSKIALNVWLQAVYLICSSKKGISSHQLHRTLGVTYKTSWFMGHRIREAMREQFPPPIGGEGTTVEAYFSILKRGINGIYQDVSAQHLADPSARPKPSRDPEQGQDDGQERFERVLKTMLSTTPKPRRTSKPTAKTPKLAVIPKEIVHPGPA